MELTLENFSKSVLKFLNMMISRRDEYPITATGFESIVVIDDMPYKVELKISVDT